jgi:hypothetical protein
MNDELKKIFAAKMASVYVLRLELRRDGGWIEAHTANATHHMELNAHNCRELGEGLIDLADRMQAEG